MTRGARPLTTAPKDEHPAEADERPLTPAEEDLLRFMIDEGIERWLAEQTEES